MRADSKATAYGKVKRARSFVDMQKKNPVSDPAKRVSSSITDFRLLSFIYLLSKQGCKAAPSSNSL